MMHLSAYVAIIPTATLAFCATGIRKSQHMSASHSENSEARIRSLLWMDMLWEGANTTAREEDRKEEVLELFRELARDSRSKQKVSEYVPWEPLW
jgi:hypothetical protein